MSPHHCVSQSFALPPATKPVSHLPCSLPPNQSVICLVPYHCVTTSLHHRATTSPCHRISQSFALPPATKPVSHLPCPLPLHPASPHHCISQSFALPPATKPVSHLPCPLPPHHHITTSSHHHITASPCHRVTTPLHHHITASLPQIFPTTWV